MLTHVVIHHQNFTFINTIIDVTEKSSRMGASSWEQKTNCLKFKFHVKAYILIVVTNKYQLFSLKWKAQFIFEKMFAWSYANYYVSLSTKNHVL